MTVDRETINLIREAAIAANVKVITTAPFGDHLLDNLVDVREVVRRAEAGEPIKDLT